MNFLFVSIQADQLELALQALHVVDVSDETFLCFLICIFVLNFLRCHFYITDWLIFL